MDAKAQAPPHERQAFGLRVPVASHPELRRLRAAHTPAHQGWRLWSATWLLLDYMTGMDLAGRSVLDAGCGWGLVAAGCAHKGARVTAFDLDPAVLPLARFHADLNDTDVTLATCGFADVDDAWLADADWLIAADVCFRPDLAEDLFHLLERARTSGTRVAVADPGRPAFQSLASRCVDELAAWTGPVSTPEPLVAWPGERPQVHGRLLLIGADPPPPPPAEPR